MEAEELKSYPDPRKLQWQGLLHDACNDLSVAYLNLALLEAGQDSLGLAVPAALGLTS